MIARVSDGLPLATSIEGDEERDHNMVKYSNQAKMLFRKLNRQSPTNCSLESGTFIFHYQIDQGVCFLCLCERSFPVKVAFQYLNDLANEFNMQYGSRVDTVSRPYHFIEFDQYIQQARRRYTDSRTMHSLSTVSNELQDVQKIMVQNIEDVIHRGEALTMLDDKAANLSVLSKKYREDARQLNLRSMYAKIGVLVVVVVLLLLYIRFKWW
jgi:vesicle transport protein SEC22